MILKGIDFIKGDNMLIKCDCLGECQNVMFTYYDDDKNLWITASADVGAAAYDTKLRNRLKSCLRILFKRKVYSDGILIRERSEIKEIIDYLNDIYERWGEN